jgi:hypothetical protein
MSDSVLVGQWQEIEVTVSDSLSELEITSAHITADTNCPSRTFEANGPRLNVDWEVSQPGDCEVRIHADADGYASSDVVKNFRVMTPGPS